MAVGAQFDLFPTLVSAVNGKAGYAPQVWAGIAPVRIRFVGAHLSPPDAFTFDDRVDNPSLTVLAATIDYTFGQHFDGPWLGAGVESWIQRASAVDGSGTAEWSTQVFTIGAGYIWRFAGNFYLDPWLGVHGMLNSRTIQVGRVDYSPTPVQASASVKVGWFFWAK